MVDFEKLLFQAKLSEGANRPEKTFSLMEQIIINKKEDLTPEERNLFANSYKQITALLRASCNKINEIYETESKKGSKHLNLILKLKEKIESQIKAACNKMIEIIDKHLLEKAKAPDSKTLYFKLKGDYNRYLAMFFTDKTYTEQALSAYKQATEKAENLSCISPIKIDLALSFSVFYYDVLKSPEDAINIAKDALNEALDKLQIIGDSDMKEVTTTLQILKDNVDYWEK